MTFRIQARAPVFFEPIAFADIVINLFVFFLLSFGALATFEPRVQGTFPIELPRGGERVSEEKTQAITISIDAAGNVSLHGKTVFRSELKRLVARELRARKVKNILVRADRAVTLQSLLPILDALRTSGAHAISIETLPPDVSARP